MHSTAGAEQLRSSSAPALELGWRQAARDGLQERRLARARRREQQRHSAGLQHAGHLRVRVGSEPTGLWSRLRGRHEVGGVCDCVGDIPATGLGSCAPRAGATRGHADFSERQLPIVRRAVKVMMPRRHCAVGAPPAHRAAARRHQLLSNASNQPAPPRRRAPCAARSGRASSLRRPERRPPACPSPTCPGATARAQSAGTRPRRSRSRCWPAGGRTGAVT